MIEGGQPLVHAEAVGLLRGDDLAAVTLAELEQARVRLWGTMFIVSLDLASDPLMRIRELADALVRASRRGVDVRLLVDRFTADDGFETNLIAAHWLIERGVAVRVHGGRRKTNHVKSWIADDAVAIVGSANWSTGGLCGNVESSLHVRSTDLNALLAARFERGWTEATVPEAP